MGRQSAYRIVRKCAMDAYAEDTGLREMVSKQEDILKYMSQEEIDEILDPHTYLGSSDKFVDNVIANAERFL